MNAVDAVAKTIESIADLYDALGGANAVDLLLTFDSQTQEWFVYFGPLAKGTSADRELTDDMGIIADMKTPVSAASDWHSAGDKRKQHHHLKPGLQPCGIAIERFKTHPCK